MVSVTQHILKLEFEQRKDGLKQIELKHQVQSVQLPQITLGDEFFVEVIVYNGKSTIRSLLLKNVGRI